ncbi:hypothetical protein LTR53_018578, partial [Teratosphaeriaceae sp. CCFEE 6253]
MARNERVTASRDPSHPEAIVVAGVTMSPGGQGAVVHGQNVRAVGSGMVLDGSIPIGVPGQHADAVQISGAVALMGGLTLAAISAPGVPGAVVIDGNTLYADGAERVVDGYTISGVVGRVIVLGTTVANCAIASAEEPLTAAGVTVVQEHIE